MIVLSFAFYSAAVINGALFGTPEGEIDSIINEKMKTIIQVVESDAAAGTGQVIIGDQIDKIQFALKIVPSMDNHKFILKRMKLAGGPESKYDGFEGDVPYNTDALGDYSDYPYFFEWNGAKTVAFPTFRFDKDNVPIGDSTQYCFGLFWIPKNKRDQFDKYMEVKGFEHCKLYADGIAFWEDDYPKHGVNFKLWDQVAKKGDSSCKNGIYYEPADTCFTYKIFQQICILVKFKKDKTTNSYTWVHTGGCY